MPPPTAVAGVAVRGVPGRMEQVDLGQGYVAVVDYAHSPDAVQRLLAALRPAVPGRVVLVLGAGGDRDRDKRPLMGAAGAAGADVLLVTDDNPRSEDPAAIRAAVLAGALGVPDRGEVVEVAGRRAAIAEAVRRAGPGTRSWSPARGTSRARRSAEWCTRSTTGRCCGPRWRS